MSDLDDCPTCGQPPQLLDVHAIADERDRLRGAIASARVLLETLAACDPGVREWLRAHPHPTAEPK